MAQRSRFGQKCVVKSEAYKTGSRRRLPRTVLSRGIGWRRVGGYAVAVNRQSQSSLAQCGARGSRGGLGGELEVCVWGIGRKQTHDDDDGGTLPYHT